jgi:hypothetical protein
MDILFNCWICPLCLLTAYEKPKQRHRLLVFCETYKFMHCILRQKLLPPLAGLGFVAVRREEKIRVSMNLDPKECVDAPRRLFAFRCPLDCLRLERHFVRTEFGPETPAVSGGKRTNSSKCLMTTNRCRRWKLPVDGVPLLMLLVLFSSCRPVLPRGSSVGSGTMLVPFEALGCFSTSQMKQ